MRKIAEHIKKSKNEQEIFEEHTKKVNKSALLFSKRKHNKNKKIKSVAPNIEFERKEKKTLKTFIQDFPKVSKAGARLIKYVFQKSPGFMILFIVTIVIYAILPFVNTWVGSLVIDQLVSLISDPGKPKNTLYWLIGAGVAASIMENLVDILNVLADSNIWFKVGRDLQFDFTRKFSYLDYEYYDDPKINNKINKVKQNFGAKPQQFTATLLGSLESIITIISATTIFLAFSPLIIIIMLVSSLPVLVVSMAYGRRSWGIWNAKGDLSRDFWATREYLQNELTLMELKIFRVRKYLLDRLMKVYDGFQKEQLKIENKRNITVFLLSLFRLAGRTAAYLIVVIAAVSAKITIGQFNFYASSINRLQGGFSNLLRRVARLYEYGLYIVDMWEFMDLPEKIPSGSVCLPDMDEPPRIVFSNLTFKYPSKEKGVEVLKNINLTIDPGEHIAIVGENGAGKTTLIKLLMRFYDTTQGHILIDGMNIKELDLENWYSHVGALFQDFNFYHFTAKENIGVGDTEKMDDFEKIVNAAKSSGADDFIQEYEHKYNQMMSKRFKRGINPSTGQRQRIALARTFFKDAPILILDEPTSAIDPKAEYEIFQELFEFAKGKTVIIISHRFSTVRNANRIIVLDKGEIAEMGKHEELMAIEGGIYRNAFELQRKGYE